MPFTPAHAAAVIPLARRFPRLFSLPALVVGSLSPDFEYFVRLRPVRSISHDLIGIPLLCLPTGLVVLLVFDRIMKRPLIQLTPRWMRLRLLSDAAPLPLCTPGAWMRVVVSIAVGALTHLIWDGFTHEDGWFVLRSSLLTGSFGTGLRVYKILQHLSTFIGMTALVFCGWKALELRRPADEIDSPSLPIVLRLAVCSMILIGSVVVGLIVARFQALEIAQQGPFGWIVRSTIAAISASLVMLLFYSLIRQWLAEVVARRLR